MSALPPLALVIDHDFGFLGLAASEQSGGRELAKLHDHGLTHLEVEGEGEAGGLFQPGLRMARGTAAVPRGMDNQGALDGRLTVYGF